ncbi:MAG: type I DNA topoisomerase [Rickettsiales bacterium]|nr:type I DNA topoisomerase [Rickettsiales bacterium]
MYTVVVESPSKAKTINKYLGSDYKVVASFGHVRDLPSKDGSVRPDEDFAMDYEVEADSKRHIKGIVDALKGSHTLYLATDPDREGEAISWHIVVALKDCKALKKDVAVKRIVFHEITKRAVTEAIQHPRDIDMDLVNAQQARRALDYLVGFNLSPVLWRKLPGSRSAGRVQSVALRLICERDEEIELFESREYWDITTTLRSPKGDSFPARLTFWSGEKLEKFSLTREQETLEIAKKLEGAQVKISEVTPKQQRRNPFPPFTTSTLQMDASRKLGFGAKKTMQIAQKLYEGITLDGETVGLITYMRTDGVSVSDEALNATRKMIQSDYGREYLPDSPRRYQAKAKNAQEAHEAIRPTDVTRAPEQVKRFLDNDQLRLYDLIWKRMVASQMEAAVYDQVVADFTYAKEGATLRANGSVLKFEGFLTLYREGRDDDDTDEDENSRRLPPLIQGEVCDITTVKPEQHFTEPPPRFTEASLVKRLEELGIGRPSTYASIISVLQDRSYVRLDKKRFIAEARGRLVNAFLISYFKRYVEYDFTANLESQLDDVSAGERAWKEVLREFWTQFTAKIGETKELTVSQVLTTIDALLAPFLFETRDVTDSHRTCPTCNTGKLHLKTGKFGAFLGCDNYPECKYTRQLGTGGDGETESAESAAAAGELPKSLGHHPEAGAEIWMKKGPYGIYVEMNDGGEKPKRASLPKGVTPDQMTLERAISLLALPRDIGIHPESAKMISAGLGRFGPYIKHDGRFVSLKGDDDVLTIGMNRAVALLAEAPKKGGAEALRTLGAHPDGKGDVAVFGGKYGPYVKHGKINATLPKELSPEEVTLDQAVELLAARAGSGGKSKGKSASRGKSASGKAPSKKTVVAKKPLAKKAAPATKAKKKA